MKKIKLTQGKFALVDNEDYTWLNQWKWCAAKSGNTYYARRCDRNNNIISMHREILELKRSDPKLADHKDRNGLNNQKNNLRIANKSLNSYNRKMQINNTSEYKGVFWHKKLNKWRVQIKVNGKRISCGCFKNIKDAAKAFDTAAIKYRGATARLNFPLKRRTLWGRQEE